MTVCHKVQGFTLGPQDAYQSNPNTNSDATTISTAVYFRAEVLNFMAFLSCTFPFWMFAVCATACNMNPSLTSQIVSPFLIDAICPPYNLTMWQAGRGASRLG